MNCLRPWRKCWAKSTFRERASVKMPMTGRGWLVPAIFVVVGALSTVPWTLWVLKAAYERDVNEKVDRLAQRVKIQLSTAWYWSSPQQVIEPLKAEILGDNTIQAVAFLDYSKNPGGYVRR